MADTSKIEWTDATWNVVTGCEKVSPGCDNCYAETFSERWRGIPGHHFETGFDVTLRPERLTLPLRWRKPKRVFVNSMSDLFHKDIPDEYIARVFAVMSLTPQHTYQILSKRHARMRSLLSAQDFQHKVAKAIDALSVDLAHDPKESWADIPGFSNYQASTHGNLRGPNGPLATCVNPQTGRHTVTLWNSGSPSTQGVHRLVLMAHMPNADASLEVCHKNGDKTDNRLANLRWGSRSENQREKVRHGSRGGPQKLTQAQVEQIRKARKEGRTQQSIADEFGVSRPLISMIENGRAWSTPELVWPLPNVWLGVSVEDQKRADLRIPALVDTPAAVRFLSCEPLLGPVDLFPGDHSTHERDYDGDYICLDCSTDEQHVPWRTVDRTALGIDWVIVGGESGRGARPMAPQWATSLRDQCQTADVPFFFKQWGEYAPTGYLVIGGTSKGTLLAGDPVDDLGHRVELARVGKKNAGRELDGRTHDAFPAPR